MEYRDACICVSEVDCGETTEIKKWKSRGDRGSEKGMEGISGGCKRLGWAGGGNEKEQWWSAGKGKPSKHFPVHFSLARLN